MQIESSAFPAQKSPEVNSQVHQLLQKHLQKQPIPSAQIRQYRHDDLQQLKKLQNQWFPLKYSDNFYNRLLNGSAIGFVAQTTIKVGENENKKNVIVGAVVFQFNTDNQEVQANWFKRVFSSEFNSLYIMTLGVVDELRSSGLAKRLLDRTITFAQTHPNISIISLHVVSYNKRAIKFYKKHNFDYLEYLQDHYHIMGKQYDGLKLGLFINGAKRREKWLPWFKRVVFRMDTADQWPV